MTPLLEVSDLRIAFGRSRREVVHGISFGLEPGERLGLIGESGSGKTVTALAVMGLLAENAYVSGSIRLAGRELVLHDAQTYIFTSPVQALWPGLAIALSVLGLNLLGDGLRDHLDPRLREAA